MTVPAASIFSRHERRAGRNVLDLVDRLVQTHVLTMADNWGPGASAGGVGMNASGQVVGKGCADALQQKL